MTAAGRSRVERGRRTQRVLADYLARHGWPFAEPVGAFAPGADVTGTPGLSIECKATGGNPLPAALRQAEKAAGTGLPLVVWRPNGYGEERAGEWVVALRLEVAVELLRDAGYGGEVVLRPLSDEERGARDGQDGKP